MALQSTIVITHDELEVDMTRLLIAETGNRFLAGQKLMRYIRSLMGGSKSAKVVLGVNAVKASGTLTGTSVIATDAISINGTSFTCVASGATGNQFNVGADDTETMANLAAAINASSDMTGIATAESSTNVCTVYAANPGFLGNAITLASADATIVASAARLSGGTNGAATATHYYGSAS